MSARRPAEPPRRVGPEAGGGKRAQERPEKGQTSWDLVSCLLGTVGRQSPALHRQHEGDLS